MGDGIAELLKLVTGLALKLGIVLLVVGVGCAIGLRFGLFPPGDITDYVKQASPLAMIIGGCLLLCGLLFEVPKWTASARIKLASGADTRKERERIYSNITFLQAKSQLMLLYFLKSDMHRMPAIDHSSSFEQLFRTQIVVPENPWLTIGGDVPGGFYNLSEHVVGQKQKVIEYLERSAPRNFPVDLSDGKVVSETVRGIIEADRAEARAMGYIL